MNQQKESGKKSVFENSALEVLTGHAAKGYPEGSKTQADTPGQSQSWRYKVENLTYSMQVVIKWESGRDYSE